MHTWMKAEFRKILKPSCLRNKVRHKPSCSEALQQHALWERWQEGLQRKFTLPQELPPLRMLLVLDNLVGHKSAEMVLWWVKHGIMPLYTPISGSWLNMAESIQKIIKTRALSGTHPPNAQK